MPHPLFTAEGVHHVTVTATWLPIIVKVPVGAIPNIIVAALTLPSSTSMQLRLVVKFQPLTDLKELVLPTSTQSAAVI